LPAGVRLTPDPYPRALQGRDMEFPTGISCPWGCNKQIGAWGFPSGHWVWHYHCPGCGREGPWYDLVKKVRYG
jgi:hypothetical protein